MPTICACLTKVSVKNINVISQVLQFKSKCIYFFNKNEIIVFIPKYVGTYFDIVININ